MEPYIKDVSDITYMSELTQHLFGYKQAIGK